MSFPQLENLAKKALFILSRNGIDLTHTLENYLRLQRADQRISGFDKGIDAKGNLVLDINGEKKVFNSGEVGFIRREITSDQNP